MAAQALVEDSNVVQRALSLARNAWPTLSIADHEFIEYLNGVGADAVAVDVHGVDLVLAAACATGDVTALSLFERFYIRDLERHVARLRLSSDRLEELRQLVRVKLFTGPAPRIRRFEGRGPLGAWFRMLALRVAIDHVKVQLHETELDSKALESLIAESTPADHLALRQAWEPRLRHAVEQSLAELPARDKTILRLHYIEDLNIEAIGSIYQVHRATVARWLLAIRAGVLAKIREQLAMHVPSTTSEIHGVVAALQSELQVSISRVLGRQ